MAHALRITVDIPAPLAGQLPAALADRARLLLVIDEVRLGRLTRGGAARALEMPLDDFLIEAGKHGLYAIDYDLDDFRRELDGITALRS
jgi:predicted HTH domain antitoxin